MLPKQRIVNRVIRIASCGALATALWFVGREAHAQSELLQSQQGLNSVGSDASLGVAYLPTRGALPESGVRLSETSLLHVGLGVEAGYDTNVFYTATDTTGSAVLRLVPFIEITNAGRDGAAPPSFHYDLSANLLYREYLSSDSDVKAQRAFNPVISGVAEFGANQNLSLALTDTFVRSEEPPYGPGEGNIARIYNLASAALRWAPGGGRLQGSLRYTNSIDYFETDYLKGANNVGNEGALDLSWRWLPKTAIFLQYSQGYIAYTNKTPALPKQNSIPMRALVGLRGLITEKLSLQAAVGYTNGFYQGGVPSPSGVAGLVEANYNPVFGTFTTLGYRHEFQNSVAGDYYNVDRVYLSLRQAVAQRVLIGAFAKYENRRYSNFLYTTPNSPVGTAPAPVDRTDNVFQGGLTADFYVHQWFYAGASYTGTVNRASINGTSSDANGLKYDKHLFLARLGVTY